MSAEISRRYRARHPARAKLVGRINNARSRAALVVARRYPREFEKAFREECRRDGIPRFLPPLDPRLDGRSVRERS